LSKNELVEFLKTQIKIEKAIVDSVNKNLSELGNPVIKSVLKGISLDSEKHAEMYDGAVSLLTNISQALSQEQFEKQKKLVEKHIRIEAELIEKISNVISNIENENVKFLLNTILADEKRHHEILQKVLETLVLGETITEEDWWDILWKNVPFHGTPGG
jgi:rubrerythrin